MNTARLETDDQKASYALGLDVGTQFRPAASLLDMNAFAKGVEDALMEVDPAIDPAELQPILQAFTQKVRDQQMAQREEDAATNREEGAAYLEENGAREEVTITESGLQYEVVTPGDGPTPGADDRVRIQYRGTLVNGEEFDSSYSRGTPAEFSVGGVIPGFSEGLQLMEVGSTYRFVIPSDLAYGPQGSGAAIGPDATLIFEVELLEILES
jgi:FKBP-type peptidyl-prolyl cis-trans isomerase FkpA/FKBP-type peptidyl-prolyl cis-trans isomerase FklB